MSKYVSFGEIMLRLKTPVHERFFQSPAFEATFGGGEANVAVSLSNYGFDAGFVTALPDNDIGDAALRELRRFGVDVSHVRRSGSRVGIYFLETGSNQRPSKVVYDRANASIAEAGPGDFDWKAIFSDAKWFHITGITPALSQSAADLSLEAVKAAKEAGVTVSCDFNFRGKLWKYGKTAPEVMNELVKYVDVGIANEEDCQKSLGIEVDVDVESGELDTGKVRGADAEGPEDVPGHVDDRDNAARIEAARTATAGRPACATPTVSACRATTRLPTSSIASAAATASRPRLIYGLNAYDDRQQSLEFAVAASCLKHSIPGDFNRVTVPEVENLMGGDASGRVQR